MKGILIETSNQQQIELVEAFIHQNQLKGYFVSDEANKAINSGTVLEDAIRMMIPIL